MAQGISSPPLEEVVAQKLTEEQIIAASLLPSDFKDKARPTSEEMNRATKRLKGLGHSYILIAKIFVHHDVGPVVDPPPAKK